MLVAALATSVLAKGATTTITEQTEGFIIDWDSRVAAPPASLLKYEVAFFVEGQRVADGQPAYVVSYAHDPASGNGYVYLPGRGDAVRPPLAT